MSSVATFSADEFNRLAELHCPRWEARSIDIVRAVLVDSRAVPSVAKEFGIKPQHARVLLKRFNDRLRNTGGVKLPAEQYMQSVKPAYPSLEPYRIDLIKLTRNGYAFEQIADFLRANEVQFTDDELKHFLKGNQ